MKRPTFMEGVGIALAASIVGGVLFSALGLVLGGSAGARLLIAGVALAYVIYLLSRSGDRVGRITVLTLWLIIAGALWLLSPPLTVYLLLHVGMLWLIRSLYFYSSVLSSLADLSVSGLSVAAALWAAVATNSIFISIWCFFLTQALFVFIPATLGLSKSRNTNNVVPEDHFDRAYREAEVALRKYSSLSNP